MENSCWAHSGSLHVMLFMSTVPEKQITLNLKYLSLLHESVCPLQKKESVSRLTYVWRPFGAKRQNGSEGFCSMEGKFAAIWKSLT